MIRTVSSLPRVTSRRRSPRLRYVYGIVTSEKPEATEAIDLAGVDYGERVFAIRHNDLTAIVSRSHRSGYRGMAREHALRCLVTHQRVLEAIMKRFTVLPVRFGTVLPGDAGVRHLLQQASPLLASTLAELSGCVQTEVVVTWRLEDVFRDIAAEPQIARATAEIARELREQADVARVGVGRLVKASLDRRRAEMQSAIVPALRAVSLDLAVNTVLDDEMVLNLALLLGPGRREALDRVLAELDRQFGGRLCFRCVGPLPPYSFATVSVEVLEFAPLDRARRLLGLGPQASYQEIRQAYRMLAGRRHPDVSPEAGEARMAALNEAYGVLTIYTGMAPSDDERLRDRLFAFDRRSVANRLVIAVQRHEAA